MVTELRKLDREDILVVVGGVIPAQDYEFLKAHGAAAIFGPGTVIPRGRAEGDRGDQPPPAGRELSHG